MPRPLGPEELKTFRDLLKTTPKALVPVAVLPLDDASMVRTAQALLGDGVLIEAMLDRWVDELRVSEATGDRLADVLHRAWRIHVVRDGNARDAIEETVSELANEMGAIDVCP